MKNSVAISRRREFLGMMGSGLVGLSLSSRALPGANAKPLHGLFPIAFTPATQTTRWTWRAWRRRSSSATAAAYMA